MSIEKLRFLYASVVAVVSALCFSAGARAQPWAAMISQTFAPDARALGMGRAFTALAEGPAAAYWNPAALALGDGPSAIALGSSPHVELLPGLGGDVYFRSFHGAARWGGYGIGAWWSRLLDGDPSYAERTLGVGAGVDLSRTAFPGLLGIAMSESAVLDVHIALGANLKDFESDFEGTTLPGLPSEPVHREGRDWDVGTALVARLRGAPGPRPAGSRWFAAARFAGVLSNVADGTVDFDDGETSALGRSLRLGVGLEAGSPRHPVLGPWLQARAAVQTASYSGKISDRPDTRFGFELAALDLIALRLGHVGRYFDEWTAGFGLGFSYRDRFEVRLDASNLPAVEGFPSRPRTQYSGAFRYVLGRRGT